MNRAYAIKVEVKEKKTKTFTFLKQKTMYGGKKIAAGDTLYIFDSENEGGSGLLARGVVTEVKPVPKVAGVERQTPRVSIKVTKVKVARRPLGRADLKPFSDWKDGRPETELNFKFYRQATNKIVGLEKETATFLETFF